MSAGHSLFLPHIGSSPTPPAGTCRSKPATPNRSSPSSEEEEKEDCRSDMPRRYYIMGEMGPQIIKDVLEARGWEPYVEGESPYWNLWWKGSRYRKSDYDTCQPWQRLNHFPKTLTLTRKDTLYRVLRTMRGIYGSIYDFVPLTFSLPNDYTKFVRKYAEEEEGGRQSLWICKPADMSRGRGIYVFRHVHELTYDCNAIVQRYIPNPLLIAGYKFDMRCYVVVRSYSPLVVYLSDTGVARFATSPYGTDDLSNHYAHLTNTSINKLSPSFAHDKEEIGSGCRWTFAKLKLWIEEQGWDWDRVWRRIQGTILLALLPIAAEVPAVPSGCFELYGFDMLIDEMLMPWLLEVNFGPALAIDSDVDAEVKIPLLEDIFDLVGVTLDQGQAAERHYANQKRAQTPRGLQKWCSADRFPVEKSRLGQTYTRSLPNILKSTSESRTDSGRPFSNQRSRLSTPVKRETMPAPPLIVEQSHPPPIPPCQGRLNRIFPWNKATANLAAFPLKVGKPALKQITHEIRRTLMN